eukprot:752531-Hanusia_phi.AAC.1
MATVAIDAKHTTQFEMTGSEVRYTGLYRSPAIIADDSVTMNISNTKIHHNLIGLEVCHRASANLFNCSLKANKLGHNHPPPPPPPLHPLPPPPLPSSFPLLLLFTLLSSSLPSFSLLALILSLTSLKDVLCRPTPPPTPLSSSIAVCCMPAPCGTTRSVPVASSPDATPSSTSPL